MSAPLLNTVSVAAATRQMFRYLAVVHFAAAAVILALGQFTAISFAALLFIGASALVNRLRAYRRSPFALIASVVTCLYFVIPLAFIASSGDGYQYGTNIGFFPAGPERHTQVAPLAVAFLTLLFVSGACGLCLGSSRRKPQVSELMHGLRTSMPIGILALIVLGFTNQSLLGWLQNRATGGETAESLWQFIFVDTAYLMLLPVVVSFRLTQPGTMPRLRAWWSAQFALILFLFFAQGTLVSLSKGSILLLFTMSFVVPLSYLQASRDVVCLMPSRKAMVVGLAASVLVFFLAQGLRSVVFSGDELSVRSILAAVSPADAEGVVTGFVLSVGHRLSAAIDAYVLIFEAHLYNGHSSDYTAQFTTYLAKNFANLVLLGTPYPEAYAPSSNLLPVVLTKGLMDGEASKATLILSLNTQPYTLFGVAIILLGAWAPAFVFAFFGVLAMAYRWLTSVPARLALIYLYAAAVHSYGFEVIFANAIHMGVSLFIFIWLMRRWRPVRFAMLPDRGFTTRSESVPGPVPVDR